VNPCSESPGDIRKFALGRQEGDVPGSDHMSSLNASARSAPSFAAILRKSLIVIGIFFLEGCGSSHHRVPSLDVFGSYFPAWLLSLSAGVVLTIIAAGAARLLDIRPSGLRALILSVSLILIFSISIWFWFFAS
jgi:hypothetical protein